MSIPNFQSKLGTTGSMSIQADSLPTAIADADGRTGWFYEKNVGGADRKLNWYFYSGANETLKIKDVLSMSFLGSIDKWTKVSNQAPFFVLYTKMTGDGDAGAWYHSKHAYALNVNSQLIRAGERCQFYCLAKPVKKHFDARLIEFSTRIDTGAYDINNEVLALSLHTDSAADEVSLYCDELQANFHSFVRGTGATNIQLKLLS
tara:strand:+ start:215 stop:826 length:612 start_codon:yes stop_codon:yes gene_type:complete